MSTDSQSQFSPEEKALAQQLFRMGSGGKGFLTGAETAPLLKRSKLGDAILAQVCSLKSSLKSYGYILAQL